MRCVMLVLLASAPAFADDNDAVPTTFHKGQLGVSARLGLGMRGIATYDSKVYCGTTDMTAKYGNAPVCTSRAPIALDLEAAYGVAQHVEAALELTLGFEKDFGSTSTASDGSRPLRLAGGARFFVNEGDHTKLFAQPMAVIDFTNFKDTSGASRGNDYGFRFLEGFWIDLHRSYGLYFFAGETLEVARWLDGEIEAGIGFQGRYP